jgi:2-(1,2-epoxy-1,2-dihydrophenyl)acetyl-CoA isomerase
MNDHNAAETESMSEVLIETVENGVCTLTMNRVERRNALSPELLTALVEAVARASADDAVGAIVLRGAGGYFCVGGDVKAMAEGTGRDAGYETRVAALRARMEVSRLLHQSGKPSIAAITGAAAGAGLSIAMACDFRVTGRSAKLTTAFAKVGLSGDFGGTWFLTQLVGAARARELYMLSPVLDAAKAHDIGLVTEVVDDDAVHARADELARQLASGPRITLSYIKRNMNDAIGGSLVDSLDAEALRHVRCSQTDDHREAADAFMNKRAPVFTGR